MTGSISKKIKSAAFWLLPPLLMGVILTRIDFGRLFRLIEKTDVSVMIGGILLYPAFVFLGGFRWGLLTNAFNRQKAPIVFWMRHYWIGLAIGYFAPASVGWDFYRVVVAGKRCGEYAINILIILFEKILALITCSLIVIILYPFLHLSSQFPAVNQALNYAHAGMITGILIMPIVLYTGGVKILMARLDRLKVQFLDKLGKINEKLEKIASIEKESMPFQTLALADISLICAVLLLSIMIQAVSAVKNVILFHSIDISISFWESFFVAPILFFIFLLPISFGSLGVREGAFIVFFGLFGVDAESCVLVSFMNLIGLLMNSAIGVVLIYCRGTTETVKTVHH